jgi:hypothetical protein
VGFKRREDYEVSLLLRGSFRHGKMGILPDTEEWQSDA